MCLFIPGLCINLREMVWAANRSNRVTGLLKLFKHSVLSCWFYSVVHLISSSTVIPVLQHQSWVTSIAAYILNLCRHGCAASVYAPLITVCPASPHHPSVPVTSSLQVPALKATAYSCLLCKMFLAVSPTFTKTK